MTREEGGLQRRFGRPSPALFVAIAALVVASAGTGLAASGVLIRSSGQIAPHVIKGSNIAKNTIGLGNLSLAVRSKIGGTTSSAPSLAPSALGSDGLEVFRKQGPTGNGGQEQVIATMPALGPGVYAIFAKTILTYTGPQQTLLQLLTPTNPPSTGAGHCLLNAAGDGDYAAAPVRTFYSNSPGELHMQMTVTEPAPGNVTVTCSVDDPWRASDTSIIAIKLASAPKTAVGG
jgi:hypothetical protein